MQRFGSRRLGHPDIAIADQRAMHTADRLPDGGYRRSHFVIETSEWGLRRFSSCLALRSWSLAILTSASTMTAPIAPPTSHSRIELSITRVFGFVLRNPRAHKICIQLNVLHVGYEPCSIYAVSTSTCYLCSRQPMRSGVFRAQPNDSR